MSHILAAAMPKEELIGRIVRWLRNGWRAGERFRVVRTRMPTRDAHATLKPYPGVSRVAGRSLVTDRVKSAAPASPVAAARTSPITPG
jgi:hypothetical protein